MTTEKIKTAPKGFILKRPDLSRKTFQIIPYRRINNTKIYESTLEHEALSSINNEFLKGNLSAADAEMQIKKVLIPKLKNEFGMPEKLSVQTRISESNYRVFKDFWDKVYRRKKLKNPATARFEFLRALEKLGPLSLHSSDINDIQDHWNKIFTGNRHKRYGGRINMLLAYINRGFQIALDPSEKPVTKWVSWEELEKILVYVENPILKDLYRALWGTGCRLGEIFPLDIDDLKPNNAIFINKQLSHSCKFLPYTKNSINHDTIVLPPALEAAKNWLKVKDKAQYRKRCQNPLINASRRAFPNNQSKWISPHKLRHSFVRYLVDHRISLYQIKDLIGDTLKTTEDTYAGWVISSESVDFIMDKIGQSNEQNRRRASPKR